jgi:hypothetical protein
MTILGSAQAVRADWLQRTGAGILRWSLVFLLMFFGALKWTPPDVTLASIESFTASAFVVGTVECLWIATRRLLGASKSP